MSELSLKGRTLTPPVTMIETFCRLRQELIADYRTILETHQRIHKRGEVRYLPRILGRQYNYTDFPEKALGALTSEIDARLWLDAIDECGFGVLMNYEQFENLQEQIRKAPQPFTKAVATDTLIAHVQDAEKTFVESLVHLFQRLDRKYKSHDGWKVGSRVIVSPFYHRAIDDFQRVLMVLDGQKPQALKNGELLTQIVRHSSHSGVNEGETEHLKWRYFQNGNTHLWCTRDDLLEKANMLIAAHYGPQLNERKANK